MAVASAGLYANLHLHPDTTMPASHNEPNRHLGTTTKQIAMAWACVAKRRQ